MTLIWVAAVLSGAAVLLAVRPPPGSRQLLSTPPPRPIGVGTSPPRPPRSHRGGLDVFSSVGAGAGVWLLLGGWLGAALGAGVVVFCWRVLRGREPTAERRRREALERGLPNLVDLMASSLAVGAAPSTALARILEVVEPPLREELRHPVAQLRLGADPVRVWSELARHPHLGPLGRCLLQATESGVSVADALHRLSGELRHRARADVEARARAVGVKASAPLGLCLLPAFLLLGIAPLIAGLLPVLLRG